jgi:hypothetical protein
MLRPEVALRPAATRIELDAQKVPDLAEDAITHLAAQFSRGIADPHRGLHRYRAIHLQARSGQGDVFEIRHTPDVAASLVFPLHVHEVRAKHSRFNTAVQHNYSNYRRRFWKGLAA